MNTGDLDPYSRRVNFLKLTLPLVALGLLSTTFLLSRSIDPMDALPFGDAADPERLSEQRVTKPRFVGLTERGHEIIVRAEVARPETGGRFADAEDVTAFITLSKNPTKRVMLQSKSGILDHERKVARFVGDVRITTSSGYELTTAALESSLDELRVESEGDVQGQSPLGQLAAGKMVVYEDSRTQETSIRFTNGVELRYDPKRNRE
ncbi:MAG: LPS export ABC transporter periplasmic protein LptC [Aestuariivita sp.]|nr:LPS export ABC transporter periplasmic protein LptC [Aestuariivita sp.]MCY4348198.1 LPS export ABC transporter periplasmic protein LptC [Aestuariivita sp.]